MITPNYVKAWLLFFLIATVGGGVAGAIVGGICGAVLGIVGLGIGMIKIVGAVMGFVVGVPISFFTFRWSVNEYIVKPITQVPAIVPANHSTEPTPGAVH